MNPYLQDILHNITTRLAKLEESQEKKEWVGLTDEEKEDMLKGSKNAYDAIERIEAKLKEKNGG
jgi:hypothetical protein